MRFSSLFILQLRSQHCGLGLPYSDFESLDNLIFDLLLLLLLLSLDLLL